jgi:ribonuclease T2
MQALKSGLIVLGALLLLAGLYALFAEPGIDHSGPTQEADKHAAEQKDQSARFDYYVLVLSWSPTYCATEGNDGKDPQCQTSRPRNFILHGLWPSNAQGWPQDCQTGERVWVPQPVIDEMRDIMPSKNLIIHEYRSHGTCSGLSPERYFKVARDLYRRIAIPPRLATAERVQSLTPDEIENAFVAANAWLAPGMIEVTCRRRQLLDVRVCFDRDLNPRACGQNEARRACHAPSVMVSPSRQR